MKLILTKELIQGWINMLENNAAGQWETIRKPTGYLGIPAHVPENLAELCKLALKGLEG
jgi:hypothetical protein